MLRGIKCLSVLQLVASINACDNCLKVESLKNKENTKIHYMHKETNEAIATSSIRASLQKKRKYDD
jgi:hypothetical protein